MKPHKCPICNGEGIKNMYPGRWSGTKENCHVCKGTGVLWEQEKKEKVKINYYGANTYAPPF